MHRPAADAAASTPRVWIVLGDKAGDNGQVETIVAALGWPYERKYVHMRAEFVVKKPRFKPSLDHLDLANSDPLQAPWPELIITVGRRPSMVALWIQQQSGGRTRVVMVGKPSGSMLDFDLVIASAENQLPPLANYLPVTLPLMRIDPQVVAAEAAAWQTRLASLKRPLTAVLVGGQTNPFIMNAAVAQQLVATIKQTMAQTGGLAYVTTSRRTSAQVVALLRQGLPPEVPFFAWSGNNAQDNPYRALLGSADGFIVTGDSISMMVEVICMHKPLAIFPLPSGIFGRLDQARRSLARRLFEPRKLTLLDHWRHRLARLVFQVDYFKLLSSTRDFRHFHQLLVDRGLAVWAGEPFKPGGELPPEDIAQVVSRIKALFPATN